MSIFDSRAICSNFPVSAFFIFVVLYTIVCASIIGNWQYSIHKRPALDMIASMICGLLMSLLIILSFTIVQDRRSSPRIDSDIETSEWNSDKNQDTT
ncbi:hypothetical protein Q7M76_00150 [Candidatus Liberibacter asiaticus]|uniref:Uncharacterized protein n=2 Tax=Liberibacter asiaticus TaxID=34021 RepID=C6XH87_LIBAP|nr:hypothetical protein [Candidatus Liberibacter asiaticus]ACT56632.1 hypothetical protein CLIBASIA_00210 [Candidatus Liberibacter asiaticus str. psy62]AGH16400.1 hypothetical protein WSI_00125 [Candidatus Liberibacter asiaticus str. gxpsy]ALK06819.1 hypothetical protein CD16_00155 [Candidatus Liberibacter asiaticus]ASK52285.1 hypothetical protein B2I23_00160 [Candidatus Liberibacter asiaticus]AWL13607.1 hypothetical protein DIC79_00175 [Candidatus Liberibacter asiaticus]